MEKPTTREFNEIRVFGTNRRRILRRVQGSKNQAQKSFLGRVMAL